MNAQFIIGLLAGWVGCLILANITVWRLDRELGYWMRRCGEAERRLKRALLNRLEKGEK